MDIHPPHAIHSWKDFGIQLITITAGILIALSLEGVRETLRDRALVREARENIRRELADNKREVDNEIADMADRGKKIDTALRFANETLKAKDTDVHQLGLELAFPTLSTASWQTAERTGALAHMDYAEVQKYALRLSGVPDRPAPSRGGHPDRRDRDHHRERGRRPDEGTTGGGPAFS